MAAGWPTHADVLSIVRLQEPTVDDAIVESARLAAIDYCIGRIDQAISGPLDGTAPIPDGIYEAALFAAARFYRRRDSLDGTIGWGEAGIVRVGYKDPDVDALLARYLAVVLG
jgi:hypothetical protein